jgi:LacI family transcriptional regulator
MVPTVDIWNRRHFDEAVPRWLSMPLGPTAIVCADDGYAFATVEELQRRGLTVPDDVSVTGFNDVLPAASFCGGLTTIRQPLRQIGGESVRGLIDLIEGADVSSCRITLPSEIIIRNTTAPPNAGKN